MGGRTFQVINLIKQKSLVGSARVTLPVPLESDKEHHITLNV